jgi:hypothetical protein
VFEGRLRVLQPAQHLTAAGEGAHGTLRHRELRTDLQGGGE